MQAPTVTIGSTTATLVRPGTTAALSLCRSEDDRATDGHEVGKCLGAAALAMCWPADLAWPVPARPMPWRVGMKVERYGEAVLDGLAERYPVLDLLPHFAVAYDWAITSRVLRTDEVSAAEGFSAAPAVG